MHLKWLHGILTDPGAFLPACSAISRLSTFISRLVLTLTGWQQRGQASRLSQQCPKAKLKHVFSLCSFLRAKNVLESMLRGGQLVFEGPWSRVCIQRWPQQAFQMRLTGSEAEDSLISTRDFGTHFSLVRRMVFTYMTDQHFCLCKMKYSLGIGA